MWKSRVNFLFREKEAGYQEYGEYERGVWRGGIPEEKTAIRKKKVPVNRDKDVLLRCLWIRLYKARCLGAHL